MIEQRQRSGLSCSIAALGIALALSGCKANDTTGVDQPGGSGASVAGRGGAAAGAGGMTATAGSGNGTTAGAGSTSGTGTGAAGAGSGSSGAGQGGSAKPPEGGTMADASTPMPMARDPECDLSGIWIARLTTFSRDSVFNAVQTASNWFYYELEQDGTEVTVVREMDCGIKVSGSADVTLNRATTEALLTRNEQSARHVTFEKDGEHCKLSFDRFYSVRGVARATYLPGDLSSKPELSTMPALPTEESPSGSEDWDQDGTPGIAYQVAALGTRHVTQRDWNEFFSDETYPIALNATEFVAAARFDSQEGFVSGGGALGGLLRAAATPIRDAKHRIAFRRLGRTADEAGVKAVRVENDVDSCFNVQDALPHDSADM